MPGQFPKRLIAPRWKTAISAIFFFLALALARNASAVIITEIMFNPPAELEAAHGGANLEWIEIFNDEPTVVHLTGYYFSEGINFTFPVDTWLEGRT